jgi:hypothetical protein
MNSINFLFCSPRIPLLIQDGPWGVVFFQTTLLLHCTFIWVVFLFIRLLHSLKLDDWKLYFLLMVLLFATEVPLFTAPLVLREVSPPFFGLAPFLVAFVVAIFLAVLSVIPGIWMELGSTLLEDIAASLAMAVGISPMVAPIAPDTVARVGLAAKVTVSDNVTPESALCRAVLAVFSVVFSIFAKLASTFVKATAASLAMAVWVPWMVAPDVPGVVATVGSPIEVTMPDKVARGLFPCRVF